MNWKRSIGAVALLAGGWLVWNWWRGRSAPAAASPAVPSGQLSIGQVGASIREDSTPELVKLFAQFATEQTRGCWNYSYTDNDGSNRGTVWYNPKTKETIKLPLGSPNPFPLCGLGD